MSERFWSGSIAEIDLVDVDGTDAAFQIEGADALVDDITGNSVHAAAGNARTQLLDVQGKGRVLTLSFIHIPISLYTPLLAALIAAKAAGASVPLNLHDGLQTIDRPARPHVPRWFKRGEPDGAYVKDVSFTFITT